ncbi:hypothetical protein C9J85_02840 [Haloferax sp. wsp5]|nr:hypothetical protein C9J85_02840 [Haloferax sp. wsp5]
MRSAPRCTLQWLYQPVEDSSRRPHRLAARPGTNYYRFDGTLHSRPSTRRTGDRRTTAMRQRLDLTVNAASDSR